MTLSGWGAFAVCAARMNVAGLVNRGSRSQYRTISPGWSYIVMLRTGPLHVVVGGPNLPVRSGPQGMAASTRGSTLCTLLRLKANWSKTGLLVIQRLPPWLLAVGGSTRYFFTPSVAR